MYLYAEFPQHVIFHRLAQLEHLLSGSPTLVDQDQSLLMVHPCPPEVASFPSTLFDEPSCGYLLMTVVNSIMWHSWIFCCQLFVFLPADHWVDEETAGVALHLWVREFGVAYIDNDLSELCRIRLSDALFLELCADVAMPL